MNAILAQYRARTPGSAVLMERSIDAAAGGVSRNSTSLLRTDSGRRALSCASQ